jgi:cobalt-zinc-cadmium efflux system protein
MPDLPGVHAHVAPRTVLTAAGITLLAGGIEILGAWKGRSLFLLADAIHLLAHLAIFGILLIPPGPRHRHGEDLSTLTILGIVFVIAIAIEFASIRELCSNPGEVPRAAFMLLAILGLLANLATAFLFRKMARERWSFRAALAHELSDGAMTVAGLMGIPAIKIFGWHWVDPGLSLLIGVWLMAWSLRLLTRRVRGGPEVWMQETSGRP